MTNPNDAIGTNAAYGTRTSVNAFNDIAQLVNGRGILSGFAVVPKSGMTVSVGGQAGTRDVAVAEDNLGNRTCINNRSVSSVDVTLEAASVSSNRYDAIVVYANNPAQASDTTPDAPSVCGIIAVQGGSTGVSEAQIRAAITADGGTGSVAYYAVLATIYVGAGTTVITSANISQEHISISADDIGDGEIVSRMIADGAVTTDKVADGSITSDKLAPGAGGGEVVYEYVQESNAGTTETVPFTIPIDLTTYKKFVIDINYASLNSTVDWIPIIKAKNGQNDVSVSKIAVFVNGGNNVNGSLNSFDTTEFVSIRKGTAPGPISTHVEMNKMLSGSDIGVISRCQTKTPVYASWTQNITEVITALSGSLQSPAAGGYIRVIGYK